MDIHEYLEMNHNMYSILINYLECDSNETEYYHQVFNDFLIDQNILENREELKLLLYSISKITKNYFRKQDFFNKIEQILLDIKESIKQTFSNFEVFKFFKKQKRVLLFLFNKKIILLDEYVVNYLLLKCDQTYQLYFYPELKLFIENKEKKLIEDKLKHFDRNIFDDFEKKRKIGENDSKICSLIRNDSIEEFVTYINRNNLSHSVSLNQSIFETNSFLLKNKNPTLIEYAAFFGSIQIFQYLLLNNIKVDASLWLFAIHGRNNEIIHMIEENLDEKEDLKYEKYLEESIKCHNNELSNYIMLNYFNNYSESNRFGESVVSYCLHYHNYEYFKDDFIDDQFIFYYGCQYDYSFLVTFLLNNQDIDLNSKIISKLFVIKFSNIFSDVLPKLY